MKKIETLIEKAKGNKIALVVPEELIDTVEKYFDDDNLYDFTRGEVTLSIFGIDFDNDEKVLDCGVYGFYVDQGYELITLTKEDFADITEYSNDTDNSIDNRTFIVMLKSCPITNSQSNTIYFSEEECNQYLYTINNLRDVVIIPAFGKKFERKPHISIY